MNNIIAQRFTELLKDYDGTYDELAKELGFKSKSSISKYAHGQIKKIDISVLTRISEFFNVSQNWLMGITNDKTK